MGRKRNKKSKFRNKDKVMELKSFLKENNRNFKKN